MILSYGLLVNQAARAVEILRERRVNATLVNLRSLNPLDQEMIARTARATGFVVTIEDHFAAGGLYSMVAEVLVHREIHAAVLPISLEQRWFRPGLLADVLAYEGFTSLQLADRIDGALRTRRQITSGANS